MSYTNYHEVNYKRLNPKEAALPQMNDPCENCPGEQACTMRDEDRLRRKLKYFFMDPCHKWKAKRKFPWKLVLQIIKIILVTIQVFKLLLHLIVLLLLF